MEEIITEIKGVDYLIKSDLTSNSDKEKLKDKRESLLREFLETPNEDDGFETTGSGEIGHPDSDYN